MISPSAKIVQHAWREPLYGAIQDWLRNWYLKLGLATVYATAFAFARGLVRGNVTSGFMQTFFPAWCIAVLLVGMYALIQRRIDLYDDKLIVVHGRGGNRYYYSDITKVMTKTKLPHQSLVICFNSGKKRELFLSAELPLAIIIRFLSEHGVECIDEQ